MFDLISKAHAAIEWSKFPGLTLLGDTAKTADPKATLMNKIGDAVGLLLGLVGIVAVIYLIYGGFMYVTAAGDADKATKGRTVIINALIGLAIIAVSYLIVAVVIKTLNPSNNSVST
jgi:hypothetical protein